MPYIEKGLREDIDEFIEQLVTRCVIDQDIRNNMDGVANYIITRIVMSLFKPFNGWNYKSLSNIIKTLECSKLEIYRRMVGPYEKTPINKNGDLKEFQALWKEEDE